MSLLNRSIHPDPARALTWTLAAALLSVALASPALADDSGIWKALKGRIIVSTQELPTTAASDGALVASLKKAHETTIKGAGEWNLNLMIVLSKPAGATKINLVYYDVSDPKKPEQVNFTEIDVKADQKVVAMSGIVLSKDMGINPGKKFEIRATRLVGGKEDVLAKAQVTLK